ncbi:TCP-1/cpn60 chaperonin family protein [Candidatus Bathyarchaeota archaeon]|nr:TCP-1/cpn60 chaperonin family protein [Candidatus Bathyarchaeota archaeon]
MAAMEAIPVVTESGQPILILKEGTSRTRGKDALRANIMAARIIAEMIKTSLGPRGMDKMLVDSLGDVTITNDGATILKEMDVQHPAAKMMVEIAKATDNEVGDGTTSVVVLAGELLAKAQDLLDLNIHPSVIVEGYEAAASKALEILREIAVKVNPDDREILKKIAKTSMSTKSVAESKEFLADLVVDAVLQVAEKTEEGYKVDLDDIKVEKKAGEDITATKLIQGIALDKEVVHPGMPKTVKEAKIALLNCPLEIEKTEIDAKIRIETPEQIRAFLEEETRMLREMVDKIVNTGANVVICQKGIDDMAQHFLAKRGVLAVRRVKESDMRKLAKATGARIVTNIDDLRSEDLGYAKLVEERKVGEDKWVFIEGCKNPRSVTLLIRGGADKVVEEAERSVHDALCVVRDVVQNPAIVAGGGAPETEVALRIRKWAEGLSGKEQLAVLKFAEAIEIVPTVLSENAGLEPIDTIVELRASHEKGSLWAGVDVLNGKVADMYKLEVLEPLAVKEQIIKSAVEAASTILRIDDIIAAGKLKEEEKPSKPSEKEEEESFSSSSSF